MNARRCARCLQKVYFFRKPSVVLVSGDGLVMFFDQENIIKATPHNNLFRSIIFRFYTQSGVKIINKVARAKTIGKSPDSPVYQ